MATSHGEINLNGASTGQVSFSGAHLIAKDGPALTAQNLTVAADMFCDQGFAADWEIDLNGATIGPAAQFLGGLRSDQVMRLPASPRQPAAVSQPRKHVRELALADPATWPEPPASPPQRLPPQDPSWPLPGRELGQRPPGRARQRRRGSHSIDHSSRVAAGSEGQVRSRLNYSRA